LQPCGGLATGSGGGKNGKRLDRHGKTPLRRNNRNRITASKAGTIPPFPASPEVKERLAAYPDHINVTGAPRAKRQKALDLPANVKKSACQMQKGDCHAEKPLL